MLIAGSLLAAGCVGDDPDPVVPVAAVAPVAGPVEAAEFICPVMWTWVKDIGDAFNSASRGVGDIGTPEGRRQRWFDAFDEMDALNARLLADVKPYRGDAILGPLVAEIERDVPRSGDEIDDIRALFEESPEIDEERHQNRTAQVIVRVEKVIDLPKPSLAELDLDGTLLPAFRSVPSCQHSIKDVDDGRAQANG